MIHRLKGDAQQKGNLFIRPRAENFIIFRFPCVVFTFENRDAFFDAPPAHGVKCSFYPSSESPVIHRSNQIVLRSCPRTMLADKWRDFQPPSTIGDNKSWPSQT